MATEGNLIDKTVLNKSNSIINIGRKRTVGAVAKELTGLLGLLVLIFKKSSKVWVETSLTEDWTLEEQIKESEQISFHFH